MSCNSFAAERMSATVSSCWPPSNADASFKFGVTISATGRSCSLHLGTRKAQLSITYKEKILEGNKKNMGLLPFLNDYYEQDNAIISDSNWHRIIKDGKLWETMEMWEHVKGKK